MKSTVLTILFFILSFSASAQVDRAVKEIERINSMRESKAKTIKPGQKITPGTFQAVCKPVGMELKKLQKKQGWKVIQLAKKYRNSKHKLTKAATSAYQKFENNPKLEGLWYQHQGEKTYYRRIPVQTSCLNCHGAKEERPEFVKKKYPQDKAYNFNKGDLRGIYSITIPEN